MLKSVELEALSLCHLSLPLSTPFDHELAARIKDIVFKVFSKLSSLFSSFNHQSREVNLKPMAMIGFLSLATLLAVSIFRRQEKGIILPPTPVKDE
jgi:hypothetical protein